MKDLKDKLGFPFDGQKLLRGLNMKNIIVFLLFFISGFSFAKENDSTLASISYSCTSFKEDSRNYKVNLKFRYVFNKDGYPVEIVVFNLERNPVTLFSNINNFNGNFSTYEFYSKVDDYSLVSTSFKYSNVLDVHDIMILKNNNLIYTCE